MAYSHNKTTKKKQGWDVVEPITKGTADQLLRVDLDPDGVDRFVRQKGIKAKVYRTTYCPNVKSVDGAEHEIDCTICNGSGFYDCDPICVPILIQTQQLDKLPAIEGFIDGNTVLMTFPIGVELQYFTKIELEQSDIYYQRVMRHPTSSIDVLKYPAHRVNVLVSYDGEVVRFLENSDFIINVDGNIQWLYPYPRVQFTFAAIPTEGQWILAYQTTEIAIQFNSDAEYIQENLREIDGLEEVVVVGDYEEGFTIIASGVIGDFFLSFGQDTLANEDGTVIITRSFPAIKSPLSDQPYSIHYEAAAQYRAKAASHVNRFTQVLNKGEAQFVKLPEQWYAVKEYLVKRTNEAGTELQQGPYYRHIIVNDNDE